MTPFPNAARWLLAATLTLSLAHSAVSQEAKKPFEPYSGQPGRDVVWVPTPPALVEKMLDMAKVTANDFVMDLGSGDGRNIIAAAKRGAKAVGVEFNPDMVELSRQNAAKAGVGDKAQFVEGDMYKADVSKASVLALFLLTENMDKMVDNFLAMKPGSRIVVNGFRISGWTPDETDTVKSDCQTWCTAFLYIVPAKVDGAWRIGNDTLSIKQTFQTFAGTLTQGGKAIPIEEGKLEGERIRFTAGGVAYVGRVNGSRIVGETRGGKADAWSAVKN